MDIGLQRRLDKDAGALICFFLTIFNRVRTWLFAPADAAHPEKVLVILLSEMGSLVLARPMFDRLRKKYPQAQLYLLQFKKNKELTRLLDLVGENRILTIDDHCFFRFALDACKAVWRLRVAHIDTVIDCELFSRISSIFAYLSGAAVRVGFHPHTQEGLYRGGFINRPVLYNPYRHISRQFVTLVDAIEASTFPMSKKEAHGDHQTIPKIAIDPVERRQMKSRLEALDGWRRTQCPDVLVYPGGGLLPIRAWPPGHYQQLCRRLTAKGHSVGIIGLAGDQNLAKQIVAALPKGQGIDLTGFTRSLKELLVLFNLSRLLITNDGGPGHFAVLTPIQTMIFFGPETPLLYGPLDEGAAIVYAQTPCSPCLTAYNHRLSPCDGDNQCLKSIDVDDVFNMAVKMLNPEMKHRISPSS